MSPIGEGWQAAVLIIVAAALPTEIWRWLGLAIGWRINPRSEILSFVRATATGIIAAFVAHALFFPTGALAGTPIGLRISALGAGLAAFLACGGHVLIGVGAGVAMLLLGQVVFTG